MQRTDTQKAAQSQKMKEIWAARRAAKQNQIIDYKKLYEDECKKTQSLEIKLAEYEKICKAFNEKERQLTSTLHSATLEYNARAQYMLDCIKHAYMSIQFSINATNKKEDNNNGH